MPSIVPSTRRILFSACMNATHSASSNVTGVARRGPPGEDSLYGVDRGQPAGDELVTHQALVLGLLFGVVGVHHGEQPLGHRRIDRVR